MSSRRSSRASSKAARRPRACRRRCRPCRASLAGTNFVKHGRGPRTIAGTPGTISLKIERDRIVLNIFLFCSFPYLRFRVLLVINQLYQSVAEGVF